MEIDSYSSVCQDIYRTICYELKSEHDIARRFAPRGTLRIIFQRNNYALLRHILKVLSKDADADADAIDRLVLSGDDVETFIQRVEKRKLFDLIGVLVFASCSIDAARAVFRLLIAPVSVTDRVLRLNQLPLSHEDSEQLFQHPHDSYRFFNYQACFCPVLLIQGQEVVVTDDLHYRLPYTSEELAGEGPFAKVFRVRIAKNQFLDPETNSANSEELEMARKEYHLRPGSDGGISKYQIMKAILNSSTKHENVVHIVGCLQIGHKYSLFMPFALYHLDEYMRSKQPRAPQELDSKLQIIRCATGLARGLNFLHTGFKTRTQEKLVCYQIDFHPSEILIFQQHGHYIWKFSGFAISRIDMKGDTYDLKHLFVRNGRPYIDTELAGNEQGGSTYGAPECISLATSMTTSCDVWALGCLLSDVFAYLDGGWMALEDYSQARQKQRNSRGFEQFFIPGTQFSKPKVNPVVSKWHRTLTQHAKHRSAVEYQAVSSILQFLDKKVLLNRQELRCTASAVANHLEHVANILENNIPMSEQTTNKIAPLSTSEIKSPFLEGANEPSTKWTSLDTESHIMNETTSSTVTRSLVGQSITGFSQSDFVSTALTTHTTTANDSAMPQSAKLLGIESLSKDNLASNDQQSIYTSDDIPSSTYYTQKLASDIFNDIFSQVPDDACVERICGQLPELLKEFAYRIGTETKKVDTLASTQAMKFIHRKRNIITNAFRAYYHENDDEDDSVAPEDSPNKMTLQEKFTLWQSFSATNTPEQDNPIQAGIVDASNEELSNVGEENDPDIDDEPDHDAMETYKDIIPHSMAYKWLLQSLREELQSLRPCGSLDKTCVSGQLRDIVYSQYGSRVISSGVGPPRYHALFKLNWNPFSFVREYSVAAEVALESALTIVGAGNGMAEALPCSEYLERTWSLSGMKIIELMKDLVKCQHGTQSKALLLDGTELTAWCTSEEDLIYVDMNLATPISMIEVGEILSWLVTALRSGPGDLPVTATPSLMCKRKGSETRQQGLIIAISSNLEKTKSSEFGSCWYQLFGNTSVAQGFPIRRREPTSNATPLNEDANLSRHDEHQKGLEVHLKTLATLLETRRITIFRDRVYLKGFCTVLVPMKYTDGFVYWHVISNPNGQRISCADPRIYELEDSIEGWNIRNYATIGQIESARHIVGWCSRAAEYIGSRTALYNIASTALNGPRPGFAFDRITISGGKVISLGMSGTIGTRDRPVQRAADSDFYRQLEWIQQRHVVLYDTQAHRAWLVNGISALLHLLRTSILHRRNIGHSIIFQDWEIQEATAPLMGRDAAWAMLTNAHNLSLKVYQNPEKVTVKHIRKGSGAVETITETKITWTHLSDKISDLYNILWQIFDHQMNDMLTDGVGGRVRGSPRRQLEGFNFTDVATETDPIKPKATVLSDMGSGWVDLTRALQAITLFGEGFGDLILPEATSVLCENWARLPKDQHLLAVSTRELEYIRKATGMREEGQDLWELTKKQYWHIPDRIFEDCDCDSVLGNIGPHPTKRGKKKSSSPNYCDRVQVLLPASYPKRLTRGLRSPRLPLPENGAVIFGHSITFPLQLGSGSESVTHQVSDQTALDLSANAVNSDPNMAPDPSNAENGGAAEAVLVQLGDQSKRFDLRKLKKISKMVRNMTIGSKEAT
ncbi:hypothetical protein VHEMI06624 [[Torrubiella] hemipterigena]|uniref:Protein kinase domain-containing protein n=1 Tax=[Torrubiella] hemipterigena TaxID=1531966 RepID=A0A0A1T141_9HYPO|nr:hypothetical protein VHEMI06624 [[Torrubiella] hemipterigena]